MALIRNLVLKIVSKDLAAKMEKESREWRMKCRVCGHAISVWDAGGLRYGARGNPVRRNRCSACGKVTEHDMIRSTGA
jgi:hypothetical protein